METKVSESKGAVHLRRLAGNFAGKLGNVFFTVPKSPAGDVLRAMESARYF